MNRLTTHRLTNHEQGRIERLCRELDWSVDEQEDDIIRLHFNKPGGGIRKIRIANGDSDLVTLSTHSDAVLPLRRVSSGLLAYLLRRNLDHTGVGTWAITVDDDKDVFFHLYYLALGAGLDADSFQGICASLSKEAAHFDDKLREADLLD